MALATRELELVIIARDRASATLARVGGALAILGGAAARVGVEGIEFFAGVTKEALDFRKEIALAFTQVEIAGATFDEVLQLVRDSARQTSVPIEELTEAAFDIFSTLTLDNMGQAKDLLDGFAQSAVAGQAPIRDIGRAVIGWINAANMAPTLENAQRIMDIQFELVRKGAGTYTEFAEVIGKAIPPFVAANQGAEELGGALAFLTRNNLSAAEAATSASRAVELLFSAKAIKGLRSIGIEVEDDNGKFRAMDELLADVVEHFSGLSDAEKKLEFQEIFGQGRIQARRFFDLILKEGNFEDYLFLLGEVRESAGGVAEAFDIMLAEPAVQLEVMRNRFQILRQEIGDAFIPFLTSKLLPLMDRLLDFWEDLDEVQRNNIVQWAAAATVFVTIAGGITALVGSLILFFGLIQAFAGSAGVALLLGGGLLGAIAAIAAAATWALLDWESFEAFFGPMWERVLEQYLQPVVTWLQNEWPAGWAAAEAAYQGVREFFEVDWPIIWENVKTAVGDTVEALRVWFDTELREPIEGFVTFVQEKAGEIARGLEGIFDDFFGEWAPVWEQIKTEFGPTLQQLVLTIIAVGKGIAALAAAVVGVITIWWNIFGELIVNQVATFVEVIGGVVRGLMQVIEGGVTVLTGLLTGDLGMAWEGAKTGAAGAASIIGTAWEGVWDTVGNVVGNITKLPENVEQSVLDLESMFGDLETNTGSAWTGIDEKTATTVDNISQNIFNLDENFDRITGGASRVSRDIVNPISSIGSQMLTLEGQTDSSLSRIESRWAAAAERIRASIFAARNTFPIFSPGTPHSPPITKLVADSLATIRKSWDYELGVITTDINRFSRFMRSELSTDFFTPESFARVPVGNAAAGPATRIDTSIDRQVNVDKVISEADPMAIASAIAWEAINS